MLRNYQQKAVDVALESLKGKKNGIIVAPTGSGKSHIISAIAHAAGGKTIILQPTKEILEQNKQKLESLGIDVGVYSASMGRKDIGEITLATIGSIHRKKELFAAFDRIIVDECFVAGTKIDGRNIEDVQIGDYVSSFNHEKGVIENKKVLSISANLIKNDLMLTHIQDGAIISTYGHLFYVVGKGYVPAYELKNGDRVYADRTLSKKKKLSENVLCFLRNRNTKTVDLAGLPLQKRRQNLLFYCLRSILHPFSVIQKNDRKKSDVQPINKEKGFGYIEEDGTQTAYSGWKWTGDDTAPKTIIRKTWRRLVSRAMYSNKEKNERRIPPSLQGRFGKSDKKNSGGNRWPFSLFLNRSKERQEKGGIIRTVGVESVSIYKRGSEYGYSKSEKKNFVYNLEVEDNHNYFANGILVHNCHTVNSKGGMYEDFINDLGLQVIGLTATPYRMRSFNDMRSGEIVAESRILTRTRPRIFNKFLHITQIKDLFEQGYLCKLNYDWQNDYDSKKIKSTSTGQGFDDRSLEQYNKIQRIPEKIVDIIAKSQSCHCLAFTQFVSESNAVVSLLNQRKITCDTVSAETNKKDRERIIRQFRSGEIKCVVNVGVLTTGFDFPELDCIILGRPTKSVALYYQMTGRGIRVAPGKEYCELIDLCDNVKRFGKIETFEIIDRTGKEMWRLYSDKGALTGCDVLTGRDLENLKTAATIEDTAAVENNTLIITFGKHQGKTISEIDEGYLKWGIEKFDNGRWKTIFEKELEKRKAMDGQDEKTTVESIAV
jgi:DNA repair protein RadD